MAKTNVKAKPIKKSKMDPHGMYDGRQLQAGLDRMLAEQQVMNSAATDPEAEEDDENCTFTSYLDGGYIIVNNDYTDELIPEIDPGGRAMDQNSSHSCYSNAYVEVAKSVNYFTRLKAAYESVRCPVVLVYGCIFDLPTYIKNNIRNYSVMYDGKNFSYHPLYAEDEDVVVRLVLPSKGR